MKKAVGIAILVLVVLGTLWYLDRKYQKEREEEIVQKLQEEKTVLLAENEELEATKVSLLRNVNELQGYVDSVALRMEETDRELAAYKRRDARSTVENRRLKEEVQPALDANPKLRDYVGSLEMQLATKDKIIFTLQRQVKDQALVIQTQESQKAELTKAVQVAQQQLENERNLREAVESAFQDYRSVSKRKRWLEKVDGAAGLVLGVVVGAALVR